MTNTTSPTPAWTKPELKRLGTLKDVAGPNSVGNDGGPSTKNKVTS